MMIIIVSFVTNNKHICRWSKAPAFNNQAVINIFSDIYNVITCLVSMKYNKGFLTELSSLFNAFNITPRIPKPKKKQ